MALLKRNVFALLVCVAILASCQADGNSPGIEYAPQMYHSVPYEPLATVTSDGLLNTDQTIGGLFHDYRTNAMYYNPETGKLYLDSMGNFNTDFSDSDARIINMMKPVKGTVSRQNYTSVTGNVQAKKGQKLLVYNLDPEDIDWSAENLSNPVPFTPETVAEGKHLYEGFCQHCHGAAGKANGKVANVYAGVANLTGGAYMKHTPGRIFHVITYGKGSMWPHGTQINPEERWKIVHYVINKIQGRDVKEAEPGYQADEAEQPGGASEGMDGMDGGEMASAN